MSQDPTIEAARLRIQRLVEEIAALSKKEMRSEDYFAQFLVRVVQACDAKGGAVWLVGQRQAEGKSEFQLAAQVEFESSLFQTDEMQRAVLLKMMSDVVNLKQPHVLQPAHQQPMPEPGSVDAELQQLQAPEGGARPNRTPYPFLHVPLFLKEQVLGVLQVWLQPYVTAQNYAEFATFLSSLAAHVEQHLQSRRLGNLVVEVNRLQHVLKFAGDLAGSLDPLEVARLGANYGRDLIACERCSVLQLRGGKWEVLAISGQEVVEKKSSMVKAMAAFVEAHVQPQTVLLSKKELIARSEAGAPVETELVADETGEKAIAVRRTDEIDLAYFELSHVVSAAVAPMLNEDKELIGALFAESTTEDFFGNGATAKEPSQSHRLSEFLALHTGRSLVAAQDYHTLPFLGMSQRLRGAGRAVTGPHRRRVLLKTALIAFLVFGLLFYPKMDSVDGNCALQPEERRSVVPEVPGRVEKVFVREGTALKKGDPIAQLDKYRIETELAQNEQDRLRLESEGQRLSSGGDEASAQVALLQAKAAEENTKKLQADLAATTLRAPIDGIVLTKDIELRAGEFLQAGVLFCEVASLAEWEVQVEVPEKQIGPIEKRLPVADAKGAPLPLSFVLYSQSATTLRTEVTTRSQISAVAYPREKESVFIMTVKDLALPDSLKAVVRPGLTGRAKIELGRRPLLFIWGRKISNWMQLKWIG